MNRSLMVIAVMGVLGMVILSALGSFVVGKVGGAENLSGLKKDVAGIFGSLMADPGRLDVSVRKEEAGFGVVVRYPPHPGIADRKAALDHQMRRIADFVLSRRGFRKHAFVVVEIELPGGRTRASRFERAPAVPEVSPPSAPGPETATPAPAAATPAATTPAATGEKATAENPER